MLTILCFLSLLASDCRVHRDVGTHEARERAGCIYRLTNEDSCIVASHYFPCTVVEKCDTVLMARVLIQDRYNIDTLPDTVLIRCHPETTLVDSGVRPMPILDPDTFLTLFHAVPKPISDDGITMRYRPASPEPNPLDSAELADIREMLREWRVEKCYKAAYDAWPNLWIRQDMTDHWRDSCECVYGKDGGGK